MLNKIKSCLIASLLITACSGIGSSNILEEVCNNITLNDTILTKWTKLIIPELDGKSKGDAGKIAIIGGSSKYTGAPYFSAMSALKVGADLVTVITTEEAAPVIKSYSPDLIVVPHNLIDLKSILRSINVVVVGPGLGRDYDNLKLAYDAIDICRSLGKPLVIDADGLYAVYKNVTCLKDYPMPGAILTPNHAETNRLIEAIPITHHSWFEYWGNYVTVLEKGEVDQYHSSKGYGWRLEGGGSGRRVGGQGDVLAGSLGTFFNWALESNNCDEDNALFAHSIATYAAAKFTRACNSNAYKLYGRSMTTSDMLKEIHTAFDNNFL